MTHRRAQESLVGITNYPTQRNYNEQPFISLKALQPLDRNVALGAQLISDSCRLPTGIRGYR